jgi:hypothetical protein
MAQRSIKNGSFGWYEKGAMQRIESLPRKQQASCKLIYIAICSLSAKQMNANAVECFKFDIARFASVDEKTVQRYLPELEKLDIIIVSPQDRKSNGKFEKVKIWLNENNSTVGQFGESSEKVRRKFGDCKSDIYNKEINKEIYISSKEDTEKSETALIKKEYGKPEINSMLSALKISIGIDTFKETVQNQRNIAKHLDSLLVKIGKEEFRNRLEMILQDEFKLKNCNSIVYLYREIKSFIHFC